MKAAPAQQIRLLDLQEIDSGLSRLAHRVRTLPELAELSRLDARLTELRDALAANATELSDLDREQRKAESDVDQVRARTERDTRRLDAGQVSSPKELEGLQSEIASLRRRQSELEEIVLEVMERREAAEARGTALRADLAAAESEREAAEDRRSSAVLEIEADRASAADRRTRVAAEVPDDLLALYTKLRDQYDGVGAAALRYGRCEGCKLALSTSELGQIRQAPADEVLRCEDCRRILVRTDESGL
ncbi:zinc ribbon domain-containing protein [Nocardiopsis trehalosi]|uniref:zinc ribbon domain-containing protein n=1 Tax=Nocardiopsis trehalosi TaxID=109329 RepID=UPI0008297D44|nr:C4-type zinc ribbon domain-containing protein [Nocardiopsis trehalosi]